ncbi:MAG TPA: hypothetical protein VKR61_20445 [Bryobacteraceae bacterium]|nr:hypothetical protein [Bryobacteraceae bacterium]
MIAEGRPEFTAGICQYIGHPLAGLHGEMELILVGITVLTSFAAALVIQVAVLTAIFDGATSSGQSDYRGYKESTQ